MSTRCWANSLGGCDTMSGEHVISNAIFASGCGCPLVVEGVKRINGGAPTRGADKANILCRKHNSLLSPLDAVAGQVAKWVHDSDKAEFTDNLEIAGELLERWALKTAINYAAAGWSEKTKWRPGPRLVECAFGVRPLPPACGLYSVNGLYRPESMQGQGVSVQIIKVSLLNGMAPGGAYITIHGLPLFVSLFGGLVSQLEGLTEGELVTKFDPAGLKHLHHPGSIISSRRDGPEVHIAMSWEGKFRYKPADAGADDNLLSAD